jgi:hypothetical protein
VDVPRGTLFISELCSRFLTSTIISLIAKCSTWNIRSENLQSSTNIFFGHFSTIPQAPKLFHVEQLRAPST